MPLIKLGNYTPVIDIDLNSYLLGLYSSKHGIIICENSTVEVETYLGKQKLITVRNNNSLGWYYKLGLISVYLDINSIFIKSIKVM